MHPHLQMNQNMESANAHAKSALPWNLGILLEFSRKLQDSKIFRPNLKILEFLENSKIPRLTLKILESWNSSQP